jgi:head-tail adaptor
MQTSFVDSRRNAALTANFHPSLCTIQAYVDGVDGYGQPTQTWVNLAGHIDLPCSIALSSGREIKGPANEYGITTHRIALNGIYPAITRLHRAVVDGVTYGIQYASPPGHASSITVLDCTLASGGV